MQVNFLEIARDVKQAVLGLLTQANLKAGSILVVGCSSSEIVGEAIGQASNAEVGKVVIENLKQITDTHQIFLAVQCCEHLNRALVIEEEVAQKFGFEIVSVIPVLKAGGACATAAYNMFTKPVVVEQIVAQAGIDIGDTNIGMHVARVQVPVRLEIKNIGHAHVSALRCRPKFIGGERAIYG